MADRVAAATKAIKESICLWGRARSSETDSRYQSLVALLKLSTQRFVKRTFGVYGFIATIL